MAVVAGAGVVRRRCHNREPALLRRRSDGRRTETGHRFIDITLRYNRNTIQQIVVAVIAWLGLALALPHAQLKLIPAMAIAFLIGRALFWIGYLIAPVGQAFGLGLTFYPTIAAYVWLVLRWAA